MQEPVTGRVGRFVRLLAGRPPAGPRNSRGQRDRGPVAPSAGRAARVSEAQSTTFRSHDAARPPVRSHFTGRTHLTPGTHFTPGTHLTARAHLTARGALLGMVALGLVTCLLAAWQELDVLAGLGFCAGCVLAPLYARREAQLKVVLSAPVIFLFAEIVTQSLTAQGSSGHGSVLSVAEGTFLTLAGVAPWLFAGTALCIAIALFRGLPQCVRDLRAGPRVGTGKLAEPGLRVEPGLRAEPSGQRPPSLRG